MAVVSVGKVKDFHVFYFYRKGNSLVYHFMRQLLFLIIFMVYRKMRQL